jgi:hypothetical protein
MAALRHPQPVVAGRPHQEIEGDWLKLLQPEGDQDAPCADAEDGSQSRGEADALLRIEQGYDTAQPLGWKFLPHSVMPRVTSSRGVSGMKFGVGVWRNGSTQRARLG